MRWNGWPCSPVGVAGCTSKPSVRVRLPDGTTIGVLACSTVIDLTDSQVAEIEDVAALIGSVLDAERRAAEARHLGHDHPKRLREKEKPSKTQENRKKGGFSTKSALTKPFCQLTKSFFLQTKPFRQLTKSFRQQTKSFCQ